MLQLVRQYCNNRYGTTFCETAEELFKQTTKSATGSIDYHAFEYIDEIVEEVAIDRTPIAYLWLQRDADLVLNDVSQSQIINTLDTVLTQSNWKIGNIEAADYVYIYGEMPTSANPRQLLNDLMQMTAQSVNTDAQQLWDDSYLILQPGREIQTEEIQRFINFARR